MAAATLVVSLAAFGCSTTDNSSTVSGQPARSAPAAGTVGASPTSTPGSSSGTTGIPPQGMVSSSMSDVDAIAVLKADEAYRGKVLGPAAPGDNTQPSLSMQQVTGQAGWPSLIANPQVTVNSSISSAPTPGIASDNSGLAVVAIPAGGLTAGVVSGPSTVGVANTGVTGVSNVTATGTTAATATGINAVGTQGNGMVTAINPATGNAIATPTFGTSPRLNVDNGIGVTGGVGDASVIPTGNGGNATANGIVINRTASTASAMVAPTTGSASGNVVIQRNTTRRRAAATAAPTAVPVQIVTNANGSVTVTNTRPESRLRRAVRILGFGSTAPATTTTTAPATDSTGKTLNRQSTPDQQQP